MAKIDFSKLYPTTHKKICNDLIIAILTGVNIELSNNNPKMLFTDLYKNIGEENFINLINTEFFFIGQTVNRIKSSISIIIDTDKLKKQLNDESNRQKTIIDCIRHNASIRQLNEWFGLSTFDVSFIRKMNHVKERKGRVNLHEYLADDIWQFFESIKDLNNLPATYIEVAQRFNITIKEVGAILDKYA